MESKVIAEECPKCLSKGRVKEGKGLFKKWITCDNCRGTGYLGRDDAYYYYLQRGTDGKYRVADIKSDKFYGENIIKQEKIRFLRLVLIIISTIFYAIFAFIYQTRYKTDIEFVIVTVVFVGFLFVLITGKFLFFSPVKPILGYLTTEPKDYKWALKERKKQEDPS